VGVEPTRPGESRDADGFEVREGHRTPCASAADYGPDCRSGPDLPPHRRRAILRALFPRGAVAQFGRAPEWHSGGRRFDPVQLHQPRRLRLLGNLADATAGRLGQRASTARLIPSLPSGSRGARLLPRLLRETSRAATRNQDWIEPSTSLGGSGGAVRPPPETPDESVTRAQRGVTVRSRSAPPTEPPSLGALRGRSCSRQQREVHAEGPPPRTSDTDDGPDACRPSRALTARLHS
jgi:hypothetical protein